MFELFEVIVRKYKGILDDYIRLSGFEGQQAKTSSLFAFIHKHLPTCMNHMYYSWFLRVAKNALKVQRKPRDYVTNGHHDDT